MKLKNDWLLFDKNIPHSIERRSHGAQNKMAVWYLSLGIESQISPKKSLITIKIQRKITFLQ
ncbi:MAG: hypothetical protein CBC29_10245 [Methylococcaceae bacterium TMED69]|nr:MAG: hypothetical protein CBC29_10245 [Methylococcaceae bacterium TMED69]